MFVCTIAHVRSCKFRAKVNFLLKKASGEKEKIAFRLIISILNIRVSLQVIHISLRNTLNFNTLSFKKNE